MGCQGFYELQKDNKAVGLKRRLSVMWSSNKSALLSPQVESPLAMDAVLGESPFSVTDDKVSITEMRVSAISGLTLSLHPSPGNSHTIVAKATGIQTLTAPKQVSVAALSTKTTAVGSPGSTTPASVRTETAAPPQSFFAPNSLAGGRPTAPLA